MQASSQAQSKCRCSSTSREIASFVTRLIPMPLLGSRRCREIAATIVRERGECALRLFDREPGRSPSPDQRGARLLIYQASRERTQPHLADNWIMALRGAAPDTVTADCAVEASRLSCSIRRTKKLEKRPVGLVFCCTSTGFRSLNNSLLFGRTHAPPPGSATLLQHHIKNRKLILHR